MLRLPSGSGVREPLWRRPQLPPSRRSCVACALVLHPVFAVLAARLPFFAVVPPLAGATYAPDLLSLAVAVLLAPSLPCNGLSREQARPPLERTVPHSPAVPVRRLWSQCGGGGTGRCRRLFATGRSYGAVGSSRRAV